MALRPLGDRVIVKRLENERKTASGIVIPDSAAEKPDQGEVVAVGPGKKTEDGKILPVDLKAGDKVLFGKYAGQPSRSMAKSCSSSARTKSSPWSSKPCLKRIFEGS